MSADPMPTIKDILGWPQAQPPADPIGELIERAENAGSPEHGLVWAQIATARAIQAQTEQIRIANKLKVSEIEQLGELARATSNPMYAKDPAISIQGLTPAEWEGLGL